MIRRLRLGLLILCTLLLSSSVFGAEKTDGPVIQPLADEILGRMCEYLKSADRFTFRAEATWEEVLETGQKLQFGRKSLVAVRRPNGFWARTRHDLDGDRRVWYDGKTMTILNVGENVYSSVEVPATIDAAFDHLAQHYGITPPMIDVAYSDPYAVLTEATKTGFYVGTGEIRGIRCHHLAFSQDGIDWQIWVEDGLNPLLRKFVITYKSEAGQPQYAAVLSEWDFSPRLSDKSFIFLHPEDAELIELEALRLEGKAAPEKAE
jgi:hypothetical protein